MTAPDPAIQMRAVVVRGTGPPSVLGVEHIDRLTPGPGEVTIAVSYAGVGFVDTLFRSGRIPFPTPFVPGIEVTGMVDGVGPDVTSLTPGQPVAALLNDFGRAPRAGGYAEIAVAHELMCVPVPVDADLARITAALANGVTAWIALHDIARIRTTDTLLVLGASGGLGGTTARLAALHPCHRVVGVVSGARHRAPKQCTDVVLSDEFDAWLSSTETALDVVIDPVGGELRRRAFESLAVFGKHVVVGDASGQDVQFSGDAAWFGTRTVSGLNLAGIADVRPQTVHAALAAVTQLVARGILDEPFPTLRPLDEASSVHQAIENRSAPSKTVLVVRPP